LIFTKKYGILLQELIIFYMKHPYESINEDIYNKIIELAKKSGDFRYSNFMKFLNASHQNRHEIYNKNLKKHEEKGVTIADFIDYLILSDKRAGGTTKADTLNAAIQTETAKVQKLESDLIALENKKMQINKGERKSVFGKSDKDKLTEVETSILRIKKEIESSTNAISDMKDELLSKTVSGVLEDIKKDIKTARPINLQDVLERDDGYSPMGGDNRGASDDENSIYETSGDEKDSNDTELYNKFNRRKGNEKDRGNEKDGAFNTYELPGNELNKVNPPSSPKKDARREDNMTVNDLYSLGKEEVTPPRSLQNPKKDGREDKMTYNELYSLNDTPPRSPETSKKSSNPSLINNLNSLNNLNQDVTRLKLPNTASDNKTKSASNVSFDIQSPANNLFKENGAVDKGTIAAAIQKVESLQSPSIGASQLYKELKPFIEAGKVDGKNAKEKTLNVLSGIKEGKVTLGDLKGVQENQFVRS
jgi:hypothetical protein